VKLKKTFSLRARLTLLLASVTLVALGIASQVVDWRADTEMQQRFDASLLARAQSFAERVRGAGNAVELDAATGQTAHFPGGNPGEWYALTCNGRLVASNARTLPDVSAGNAPDYADVRLADGRDLRMVALRFVPSGAGTFPPARPDTAAPDCELRYALDRDPLDDILRTLDWILLGSILGACMLVLLLTPLLVRSGLRPLAVLDRAMAKIGPDTPGERLPASNTTELAPLVSRFNEVLARMDDGLARERQFASGVAHEFRTRLAELRTLIEVETRFPSGNDIRNVLGEVGSIGAELEATVTALLQLTRIQSGLEQSRPERVALPPLLARLCGRHQGTAQQRAIRLECDAGADSTSTLQADPALLEIVLDNLLGNAVTYAPPGSTVTLHAGPGRIEVCNAAPGLDQDDLVHFGERFWRKQPGPGHFGLGLALACATADALQMALSFELVHGELQAVLCWRA
jgi:signal transduction histidine kinase